jgi:hypothetical protein
MTSPSAGQAKIRLMPGTYRVDTWASKIAGKPVVAVLEDLEIAPGSTVEKTVEFFAGDLTITVTYEGEAFRNADQNRGCRRQGSVQNWSNWPKNGTRQVTLPEGEFTVRVTNSRDQKQVAVFDKVRITPGASETITVAFPLMDQ